MKPNLQRVLNVYKDIENMSSSFDPKRVTGDFIKKAYEQKKAYAEKIPDKNERRLILALYNAFFTDVQEKNELIGYVIKSLRMMLELYASDDLLTESDWEAVISIAGRILVKASEDTASSKAVHGTLDFLSAFEIEKSKELEKAN